MKCRGISSLGIFEWNRMKNENRRNFLKMVAAIPAAFAFPFTETLNSWIITLANYVPATDNGELLKGKSAPYNKIDLSKAPQVEIALINLVLIKDVYLQEAVREGWGKDFQHPGCRTVFQKIAEEYRRAPNEFDGFTALLAEEVWPVEPITRHLALYPNLSEPEARRALIEDYVKYGHPDECPKRNFRA